jgi:hypothetical protein
MTSLTIFLVLSSIFPSTFASSKAKSTVSSSSASVIAPVASKRSSLIFSEEIKWDCFYRTTSPVQGLDPMIWREDQYGNLLMAGLTYCKGALCYNFDHRFPVSDIPDDMADLEIIVNNMKSVDNCQAMSTRVNSLKGSSSETFIRNVISKFGCDDATKRIFTDNNFYYANQVQAKLIDAYRYEKIKDHFRGYNSRHNSGGISAISKKDKFADLDNRAAHVVANIESALRSI